MNLSNNSCFTLIYVMRNAGSYDTIKDTIQGPTIHKTKADAVMALWPTVKAELSKSLSDVVVEYADDFDVSLHPYIQDVNSFSDEEFDALLNSLDFDRISGVVDWYFTFMDSGDNRGEYFYKIDEHAFPKECLHYKDIVGSVDYSNTFEVLEYLKSIGGGREFFLLHQDEVGLSDDSLDVPEMVIAVNTEVGGIVDPFSEVTTEPCNPCDSYGISLAVAEIVRTHNKIAYWADYPSKIASTLESFTLYLNTILPKGYAADLGKHIAWIEYYNDRPFLVGALRDEWKTHSFDRSSDWESEEVGMASTWLTGPKFFELYK